MTKFTYRLCFQGSNYSASKTRAQAADIIRRYDLERIGLKRSHARDGGADFKSFDDKGTGHVIQVRVRGHKSF